MNLQLLSLFVPGKPAPQGSKRHVGRGILIESSPNVGAWRERIALAAHNALHGQSPADGPIDIELLFVLPRPKTTPKRRTPAATKRPDLDKLVRAVLDALTGVCWRDDSQVVAVTSAKRLAESDETAGVRIDISKVTF